MINQIGRRRFTKEIVSSCLFFGSLNNLDDLVTPIPKGGEILPFINEGGAPLNTITGAGLKGRLALDHSQMKAQDLNEKFFIRTRYPGLLNPKEPWKLKLTGSKKESVDIMIKDLVAYEEPMGLQLLECSGNSSYRHYGLISVADWSGVSLRKLFEEYGIDPENQWIQVTGFDDHTDLDPAFTPGASWIFPWKELSDAGAFLALKMNGEVLPKDHGFPVRLIVPNWYGCSNIKWVNEIGLVSSDSPATSQMIEYSGRTHQKGVPKIASEYEPAIIDVTAMPIRVVKMTDKGLYYKITGIQWGKGQPSKKLTIGFNKEEPYTSIQNYLASNERWSLWEYDWYPKSTGDYTILLKNDDPSVRARRLDMGYYRRTVTIEEI